MKFSNVDPETASAVYDMLWQPAAAGPGGPKGSPLNGGNPADCFEDEEEDGAFDPDSKYVWFRRSPSPSGSRRRGQGFGQSWRAESGRAFRP